MNRTTCPICSDYFSVGDCTACPCGHTFHYNCIKRWKVESSTCPQCRVKFKEPIKLYFEQNTNDTIDTCDSSELKNEIRELKLQVTQKDSSIGILNKKVEVASGEVSTKLDEIVSLRKLLQNSQGTNDALKRQLSYLEKYKAEAQRARIEAAGFEKELVLLQNIREMVKAERHDVEIMVKNYTDTPESLNVVSTSFVLLKKEFDKMKTTKKKIENERKDYRRKAELANQEAYQNQQKVNVLSNDMTHLNEINKSLEHKLRKLEQSFASPSPRSSAIKRLLKESPAPLDLKRPRVSDIQEYENDGADGSMILFDDDIDDVIEVEEENDDKELLREFGLNYVGTTSIGTTNNRNPLKEINKPNIATTTTSKFPLMTNKLITHKTEKTSNSSSVLPKKGFNGMGGQSKVFHLPKKTFKKPMVPKNDSRKIVKIPKNNTKISKFLTPKLPSVELSP